MPAHMLSLMPVTSKEGKVKDAEAAPVRASSAPVVSSFFMVVFSPGGLAPHSLIYVFAKHTRRTSTCSDGRTPT
ncbi:MAG: hypothetical protein Tsb0013_03920 [Phycisphaerales bacterium]